MMTTWTIKIQMINPQGRVVTEDNFAVNGETQTSIITTNLCDEAYKQIERIK